MRLWPLKKREKTARLHGSAIAQADKTADVQSLYPIYVIEEREERDGNSTDNGEDSE